MPKNALKASWDVRCGIILGEANPEFCKRFNYLGEDYDNDYNTPHELNYHASFSKRRAEAMDYYLQMSNPNISNWATIEFIWY